MVAAKMIMRKSMRETEKERQRDLKGIKMHKLTLMGCIYAV